MRNSAIPVDAALTQGEVARPLKLLVLDDNEVDRMRLRRFSEKAGLTFDCFEAHDIDSFARQIDSHEFDLMFLDYHLDVDSGLDALKMLIAHEDQVNALPIMITSVDRHDVAVAAMRGGCADFITKEELSADSIRQSVASAFERKILVTSMSNSHLAQDILRSSLARMIRTSGPEINALLLATLRKVRGLRSCGGLDTTLIGNLDSLETACRDLHGYFRDFESTLGTGAGDADPS